MRINKSFNGVTALLVALLMSTSADTLAEDTLLTQCVNIAINLGYSDEHCASGVIDACMRTQSISEIELAHSIANMIGASTAFRGACGTSGSEYSAVWQKEFATRDRF